MASGSVKSILYALVANFGIAVSKSVAAYMTGSGSMLAEAIHSFADCGNQGLLFFGLKQAKKPTSPEHPLGYGKEIYFWSFIVAIILFSMGGIFSIYEGIHKLHSYEELKSPHIAIIVLIVGIILEGASLLGCLKEIKPYRKNKSLWRWFKESRKSELVVILGEDFGALLGLMFALVAVILSMITGNPIYDAIGSIGIGVLLIIISIFIGIEVKSLLIGQGASVEDLEKIKQTLTEENTVDTVLSILTLQMGSDIILAIKAKMKNTNNVEELSRNINRIEKSLKIAVPEIRFIFFEPDLQK